MSANTYLLERDVPQNKWAGNYVSLLKNCGDNFGIINELREILTGKFKIVLKLTEINDNLYINNLPCLIRKNKFKPITVYPNVKILKGKDFGSGGSNNYPIITFKEGFCVVEVITNGFPFFELNTHRMKIEILEFEKI